MIAPILKVERKPSETVFYVCFMTFVLNLVDYLSNLLGPQFNSRVSNIESDNSQNVGLEDYNNISVGIFPHFTTPSIKITLG